MYNAKNELWWQAPDGEPHEALFEYVGRLVEDQNYQHDLNTDHFQRYNDAELTDLTLSGYSKPASAGRHKVTLNVVKSMCDTVTSEITQNKPTATFLTSGGDWAQRRKAELLDRFCQGQFYESKIYEVAPKVFKDAAVFGTGVMKIYESEGDVKVERIFPDELIVDDEECRYSSPRQAFQLKVVNKEVLKAMYPEKASALDSTTGVETSEALENRLLGESDEQVLCLEAWHLPSSKESDDGRHSIAVAGGTLLDETYHRDYFPFVTLHWSDRLLGFWGQGLAEMLTGIQIEINTLLKTISESMRLAKPKVFVETGSKITKASLNNELWGVIEYTSPGKPPQFYVPKIMAGEVYSHLDRLFERAYQIAGISEMSAQSKKPVGIESAVALREFSDIQTKRFYDIAARYENLFIHAAVQMIDIAREAAERDEAYEVVSHGDKYIEKIKWKDINLDKDAYVMKVTPTNMLPNTPAGKLEFVRELLESGLIQDPMIALSLLQYPDIEAATRPMTASSDIVDMFISEMLDKGSYQSPEPYMDLSLAVQKTQSAYMVARINKAPEDRLRLLVRFMQEVMELLASMEMASNQEQMMGVQPGGPLAGGEGTPPPAGMEGAPPPPPGIEQILGESMDAPPAGGPPVTGGAPMGPMQ
tara:strand:+ start:3171 stop:5108 length:1938 start_codon:yes stop_codon:yes gene_type:complete